MIQTIEKVSKIKQNLESKNSILQFYPKILQDKLPNKNFIFEDKSLKRNFIIDIVHILLLKYFFKGENRFNLSSLILKSKYGQYYNYYMNYLLDLGVLEIVKKHQKGVNARIYKLADSVITGEISRYRNYDATILRKYKNAVERIEHDDLESNLIDPDVKRKLIEDLFSVSVLFDEAVNILEGMIDDSSVFNRNMYSVESIKENHIFYHFDNFGRVHTNFTILKTALRKKCLLIDGGKTCEIDIKNSQPFFLCRLIEETNSIDVDYNEYNYYKKLVNEGTLYEYIMENSGLQRNESKNLIYKVFFGRNTLNSKSDKLFQKLFPSIYNFIKIYKKNGGGYKILAHRLQNLESDLIFNNIVKEIMYVYPEIKLITIHDSIICQEKYSEIVNSIFQKNIKKILT